MNPEEPILEIPCTLDDVADLMKDTVTCICQNAHERFRWTAQKCPVCNGTGNADMSQATESAKGLFEQLCRTAALNYGDVNYLHAEVLRQQMEEPETPRDRNLRKMVNFATAYGMGTQRLAQRVSEHSAFNAALQQLVQEAFPAGAPGVAPKSAPDASQPAPAPGE